MKMAANVTRPCPGPDCASAGAFHPKPEQEQVPPEPKMQKLDGGEIDECDRKNSDGGEELKEDDDHDDNDDNDDDDDEGNKTKLADAGLFPFFKENVKIEDQIQDDYFPWRKMTPEETQLYNQLVGPSQGFDAPELAADVYSICLIRAWPDFDEECDCYEDVKSCSIAALAKYNDENNHNYVFSKILKVNAKHVGGIMFYITFEAIAAATDGGQCPEIFEAQCVSYCDGEIEVVVSRLKAKS